MTRDSTKDAFLFLIWIARLGVCGLVLAAVISLDSVSTEQHRADVRQEWQILTDQVDLNLQAEILQNVQTVWGLAANVAIDPDINQARFNELAAVIFRLAPALRNIGLAPDMVIRYVYPLQGNEAAIGLDLKLQSMPAAQIRALIDTRRAVFTGPIDLVQGGQGLASRVPIFAEETGEFWGVLSVILDLDRLYETAKFQQIRQDVPFVLSASDDPSDTDAIFYGPRDQQWADPVSSSLQMPGTTWTVFAEPSGGWPVAPENPLLFRSMLLLLAGVIIGAVFWSTHLMLKDREMQIRFLGLFELAPIGIGLFSSRSGRLIRANPEFEARFGKQGHVLEFFDQGANASGIPDSTPLGLRQKLDDEGRIDSLQTYYPAGEHTVAPVRIRGLALRDTGGEPVIWLIAEDISEQKKVERMKNEFISTVSHELRTPLTSISGSLALLAHDAAGSLTDNMSRMIGIAHRNSQQLTYLINDLLDIDKLVAGKMQFQIEPIEILQLVQENLENISQFAREHKVSLAEGPVQPMSIHGDRQRLSQALNNLLSNAIKYSPAGGTVSVFTQCQGDRVRICVRDQGDGVPPDFQQRIFEKFSQADGSSRRQKGGTGLGLAITRELMTKMEGSVDYESTPGKGATFWLELPIAQKNPEA